MKLKPAYFPISEQVMVQCIEALRYMAHNEAAHSQAPLLFTREETEEWRLAAQLEERLHRTQSRRNAK